MKTLIFTIILILLQTVAMAQPRDGRKQPPPRERIESMKVGYLTSHLDLTSEEAKVFWPVYNQYQKEIEALRKTRRDERANLDFETMTDKDAEKIVDTDISFRQKELDITKKYHSQFKSVLPVKKVVKLYHAEEGFKRELLRNMHERKDPSGRK